MRPACGCSFLSFARFGMVGTGCTHHECEGVIEKYEDHLLASCCLPSDVKLPGDREGRIFLSHPHTNNGFF